MSMWSGTRVLVTGGASFIGSHLVERLVRLGARVRVVDDLSSGSIENLSAVHDDVEFHRGDLRGADVAAEACRGNEIVFHLAAAHGGRGFIDAHQYECATNLQLDQAVLAGTLEGGVEKFVFASSGCVYPLHLQRDASADVDLTEEMIGPPYEPDGLYGLAKLAGELALQAAHQEHGLGGVSCRYFTAYGPRSKENHAVLAMIARALTRQDPFEIWGDGSQVRNWTFVDDIVEGTLLAAERLDDASAINVGSTERITVLDAAAQVLSAAGHEASIRALPDKATGPMNRIANGDAARRRIGFEASVSFQEGMRRTMDWYRSSKDLDEVERQLPWLLVERTQPEVAGERR